MLKKSVVVATLLCIVIIGLASSGGGKKRSSIPDPAFTPIRATGNFSLKMKTEYAGSMMFRRVSEQNANMYKSVITYQKGNTIYILPSRYRIITPSKLSFRSNLNVIDLKIRLCR